MIKLYCFPRSGNSREVKIVLFEKNIPFESVNVRADEKAKEDPEFLKASPEGTVPAIVDDGNYLCESYDINTYLEERYPQNPLLPKDPGRREDIRRWVAKYDKSLCLRIGLLLIETLLKPKDQQKEEVKEKLRRDIHAALAEVEKELAGKEYFFGAYSLADVSLTPHLSALNSRLGVSFAESYPNLSGWFSRIQSRPSFAASAN